MSEKKRQALLAAIVILLTLICLLPLILVVIISFSDDASIAEKGFSFFPNAWSLDGYKYVLTFGRQIAVSYGVTITITVCGTILALVTMGMFAYALSRKCFQLRTAFSFMVLVSMLFSGGQLSCYMINTKIYGLGDSLLALILPECITAMHIIILRTYIQGNVPDALIEAAKIDGAGEFRTFWQIVFPVMKPSVAAVGFMVAVRYWNEWQNALLYIRSTSKTPLQLLLVRIQKNLDFLLNTSGAMGAGNVTSMMQNLPKESGRMAILMVVLGPVIIAYPFFQKYFVKGLTVGSVKG